MKNFEALDIKKQIEVLLQNGATNIVFEKISIENEKVWTLCFIDEQDSVYGAFIIKRTPQDTFEEMLDVIKERNIPIRIE